MSDNAPKPADFAAPGGWTAPGKEPRADCNGSRGLVGAGGVREWRAEGVALYLGDCREIKVAADAVISDPPYGMNYAPKRCGTTDRKWHRRDERKVLGDDQDFDPAPWLGYERVVLWGANYYADKLPPGRRWLVWDKRRGGTQNQDFAASDCEIGWCNSSGTVKMKSHLWSGLCRESEIGEHWHPTQKPVVLMAWCMEVAKVPAGAIVLDPFMGSGTTALACIRTGRRFVGIEKDEAHFATAVQRIRAELAQGILFPAGGGGAELGDENGAQKSGAVPPIDPKLSDGGGWRAGCTVGERRRQEAASVTAGAVRCSAWLGVAAIWLHGKRIHKNSSVECNADPSVAASSKRLGAVERKSEEVVVSEPPRTRLLGCDILGRRVLRLNRW